MRKRIVTVVAVALLALTAATNAAPADFGLSGTGVLVRQDDGYMITGTLGDPGSQLVGTIHGTLTELTTGFNTCPDIKFHCLFGGNTPTCNLLNGEVTLNLRGERYDAFVGLDLLFGRVWSSLCQEASDPSTYRLTLFMWSSSQVPPTEFPDTFALPAGVEQINDTLFKWSSG